MLGGAQAHDLVAEAGARAVSAGLPLRDVLLAVPKLEERLTAAGITAEQIDSALEPSGYLGCAGCLRHRGSRRARITGDPPWMTPSAPGGA